MWIFIISILLVIPTEAETSCGDSIYWDIRKANKTGQVLRLHTSLVPSNDHLRYECIITTMNNILKEITVTVVYDKPIADEECGSIITLRDGQNPILSFRCETGHDTSYRRIFSIEFKRHTGGERSNYCVQIYFEKDLFNSLHITCAKSAFQDTSTHVMSGSTTAMTSMMNPTQNTAVSERDGAGIVAPVVIGILVVLLVFIILAVFLLVRRKRRRTPEMIRQSLTRSVVRRSTADRKSETSRKRDTKLEDIEVIGLRSTTANISDDPRASGIFNPQGYDNMVYANAMDHHQPLHPANGEGYQTEQDKEGITSDDDEFDYDDDTFDNHDDTFDNTDTTFDNNDNNLDNSDTLAVYAQIDKSKKQKHVDVDVQMSDQKDNGSSEQTVIYAQVQKPNK